MGGEGDVRAEPSRLEHSKIVPRRLPWCSPACCYGDGLREWSSQQRAEQTLLFATTAVAPRDHGAGKRVSPGGAAPGRGDEAGVSLKPRPG